MKTTKHHADIRFIYEDTKVSFQRHGKSCLMLIDTRPGTATQLLGLKFEGSKSAKQFSETVAKIAQIIEAKEKEAERQRV